MRRFARFIIVLMTLMVASINNLSAAVAYPVQLNAQILPPYTNCLGDYVAGDLCRIRVTGLLRDLTKTQGYEVGISVKVMQGSQLRFSSMTNHVERLNPNEIHQFQLKDLLAEGNISAKYNGDGYCLKEGGYEFIFQAFDKGNERLPLSEPVHFFAYLSQSEPPRLISPADGECVNYQAAAVNFVWMESTVGSFNPKKQFRIEVYEVPENAENFDQQALINSNITKFTIEDIPGNLNFQSFANSAGKLVKGRTYLWRVQAFDKTTEVTDKKKIYSASSQYANGGYSKVYSFKYANCMPFEVKKDLIDESKKPEITSVDSSETSSTVHWRNEPEKFPCGYIVAFNKAGDTLSNWAKIEVGAEESSYTFKNIAPGVQYATHIIGICECNEGEEGEKVLSATSNDSTFTLPKPAEKECHSNIDALTSQKSIENLEKGSYITANGQNVKIVEIERIFSEKGDTLFTGKGVVYCPLLENKLGISVKFDSIRINENYEVMMGKVYAPTDLKNCAFLDADGLVNDNYTGTGAAPLQSEKYATYSSQNEIPVGQIGNVGGVLYAKNADGSFTKLGTLDAQAKLDCEPQENGVDYKQGDVIFSAESYWNPPFDYNKEPFKNASVEAYYLNFSMGLSKRYDAPWIAMEQGKATTIKAKLNDAQSDVEDDKIVFVCQTKEETVLLESSYDASKQEHTVTIYGGEAEKSMNIYAIYAGNGKCYTLGRARIQNMPSIEQNLVLVPMGRSKESVDKDGIQTYLNQIYGKLGVKYNVTVEDEFGKEEDGDFSFMADGLAVTGTGFMTTETDDMKTLKKLYKEKRGVKDDAAYIFILKKAKTDDGTVVAGDMPRSHQVGYVFSEDAKYSDAKTIAHELGHGLYSFEHTFENKGAAQGSTDNLMDYNDNVAEKMLNVWQWNLLYTHKNYTVPFLEDDEDAMITKSKIDQVYELLQKIRCAYAENSQNPKSIQNYMSYLSDYIANINKEKLKISGPIFISCYSGSQSLYPLNEIKVDNNRYKEWNVGYKRAFSYNYSSLQFGENIVLEVPSSETQKILDFIKDSRFFSESYIIEKNLSENKTNDLFNNLYDFSYCSLIELGFETRLQLIDLIVNKYVLTEPWENLIIRLLKISNKIDTDENKIKLYNYLTKLENFKKFYGGIDNIDGLNNLDIFIEELYRLYLFAHNPNTNCRKIEYKYYEQHIYKSNKIERVYSKDGIAGEIHEDYTLTNVFELKILSKKGFYNLEYNNTYYIPGFLFYYLNDEKNKDYALATINNIVAVVSIFYGGAEVAAGMKLLGFSRVYKVLWGLFNIGNNACTLLTGDDAITLAKKQAIEKIEADKTNNDEIKTIKKERIETLFDYVTFFVNGRNLYQVYGQGGKINLGNVDDAYTFTFTYLKPEDAKAIKEMIKKTNEVLNYDYIPY